MPSTTIQYFSFQHLPDGPPRDVSSRIASLALLMENVLRDGPEKSAGMRKLLEAKDCFVRAAFAGTEHEVADAKTVGSFGWALGELRNGAKVTRAGWNGRGMWLGYTEPCGGMTLPFIYMRTAQGDLVPWLASQTDLLATDWELVA